MYACLCCTHQKRYFVAFVLFNHSISSSIAFELFVVNNFPLTYASNGGTRTQKKRGATAAKIRQQQPARYASPRLLLVLLVCLRIFFLYFSVVPIFQLEPRAALKKLFDQSFDRAFVFVFLTRSFILVYLAFSSCERVPSATVSVVEIRLSSFADVLYQVL